MARSTVCSICGLDNLSEQRRSYTTWCKACDAARKRATYDPIKARETVLRIKYGISLDRYNEMLAEQGGKCAICESESNGSRANFAVDHDHSCCAGNKACGRCVRGLLCIRCNTLLGMVNDQPELLREAVSYLARTASSIAAL